MKNRNSFKKSYLSLFVQKKEIMRSVKHFGVTVLALFFILSGINGKSVKTAKPNDIIGIWLTQSKETMVEISKSGDHYFAKIIWLKVPISPITGKPKADLRNPDPKLRDRPIIGLDLLVKFNYVPEKMSGEGDIYDPKTGNIYNCKATLIDANTLNIRGYLGAYWMGIGRTEVWKRIK